MEDVRDILNYYSQFDNPLQMFKENGRKLLMEEKQNKAQDNSKVLNFKIEIIFPTELLRS